MVKVDPPDVSDADIESAIADSIASGEWKEAKKGGKTYFFDKAKTKSLYRKDLVLLMKGRLAEDGIEKRKDEVSKKVKSLLKEGVWKMVKGDKPYYYNPKNKKETVWDLEQKVAVELGYASPDTLKGKDKKEKKDKKEQSEKETASDKPEATGETPTKSDKEKKDKKEKKEKKEKEKEKEKEAPEKKEKKDKKKGKDPSESNPRDSAEADRPSLPQPSEVDTAAPSSPSPSPAGASEMSPSPEPHRADTESPSPEGSPGLDLPPPPVKKKAPKAAEGPPPPDPAEERRLRDEEQQRVLLAMQQEQQERVQQQRREEEEEMRAFGDMEEYVRVYTVGFSEELERNNLMEEHRRWLLQFDMAETLYTLQQRMRFDAFNSWQTQGRAEVFVDESYAFESLLAIATTSFALHYKLQIEREISERAFLREIEEEEREKVAVSEEISRDALAIVERRHSVWAQEVVALVAAWVDFTRTKFSEYYIEGVQHLHALKEMQEADRKLIKFRSDQLQDCCVCEGMARREIESEHQRWVASESAAFDVLCEEELRRRRQMERLPSHAAEKQLDLIRAQIAELKRRLKREPSPDPALRQEEEHHSQHRLQRLQASSRECELARIAARVRKLEDDSMKHRSTLGVMRNASRKSASRVKDPAHSLEPIRLQVESLQALQTHNAVAQAQPNQGVYQQILVSFYTRHDPTKIPNIAVLLQQFRGNESALFNGLVQKYKLPTNNPYKDSLSCIMQRAVPWQLPCIDIILHLYEGSEYELVNHLMQTYQ